MTSVTGSLHVQGTSNVEGPEADSLTTLAGLEAITSVGGSLIVRSNAALLDLDALGALVSIGADIDISSNRALADVGGLEALTTFSGAITVEDNASLPACQVDALAARFPDATCTCAGNQGVEPCP